MGQISARCRSATSFEPASVMEFGFNTYGTSTGYQSTRHTVNSSHGHLVTRSCCHTVNLSPVNSSHMRLVTQSTHHKRAHNKATSRNFFICMPVSTQKQCSTQTAYLRQACNIEVTDDGEALEWDEC